MRTVSTVVVRSHHKWANWLFRCHRRCRFSTMYFECEGKMKREKHHRQTDVGVYCL